MPLADTERRLLRDLFDPRRAAISFPQQTAKAWRIHDQLGGHDEVDMPRADVTALTELLGQYLNDLADTGAPVPGAAPLDDAPSMVEYAPPSSISTPNSFGICAPRSSDLSNVTGHLDPGHS